MLEFGSWNRLWRRRQKPVDIVEKARLAGDTLGSWTSVPVNERKSS